jgi:hypothetical protein
MPIYSNEIIGVPPRIRGSLDQVKIGKQVAFIAEEDGIARYGMGLENFVETELVGIHLDDLG